MGKKGGPWIWCAWVVDSLLKFYTFVFNKFKQFFYNLKPLFSQVMKLTIMKGFITCENSYCQIGKIKQRLKLTRIERNGIEGFTIENLTIF